MSLLKKLFGSRNDRVIRQLSKQVAKINALESEYEAMTDQQLKDKTAEFKSQLESGKSLNDILPFAFATVREASKRTIGLRHYDVQLMGGMVLHEGRIAEMHTGEGKTLVATLPLYLNALMGKGAHLVTVNDYLAKRDAALMSKIYEFLGMSVGVIVSDMQTHDRKAAYASDITYGTNNEFGFDYLRDNMALSPDQQVQQPLNFVVIDEVDSILIDEARTPLIISGAAEDCSDVYLKLKSIVPQLKLRQEEEGEGDFYLDEKSKQAYLTEDGHQTVEAMLIQVGILEEGDSLYSPSNISTMHYLNAMMRAHNLYHKDVDYIVRDGEIIIVDEHTGRAMPGRRWSDGLHQAIEAKEGVDINKENQTLASITFQNFFRLYQKMSGMTGTADTEAYEFHQTYGLEVVVMPTNKPMIRKDHTDMVYMTKAEKFKAIVEEIQKCVEAQQPVLVGTVSIETSEHLSNLLKKAKIKHEVLNAKQHQREAEIVAQAGRPGAVTIATNMAGRGTDIVLGGNWQAEIEQLEKVSDAQLEKIKSEWQVRHNTVLDAGGLHILGTERHESRRIDNQLRGRSGRQGDPGSSRFYLSLEDDLVRIFAAGRVAGLLRRMGLKEGEALESSMITRAIANAQKKVEGLYFDMRKNLLEYDDVANDQRQVIYEQRHELLYAEELTEIVDAVVEDVVIQLVGQHISAGSLEEQWDLEGLEQVLKGELLLDLKIADWIASAEQTPEATEVIEFVLTAAKALLAEKDKLLADEMKHELYKTLLLQSLDNHWREHLSNMDHLRQSIGLRGYAQKNPKQEYKREAFELFSSMLDNFKFEVASSLLKIQIRDPEEVEQANQQWRENFGAMQFQHASLQHGQGEASESPSDGTQAKVAKVGRNEPCPCGSGKKYKQCHGKLN